jgi:predicted lipoprotein with Yx(FWY)xxD motif
MSAAISVFLTATILLFPAGAQAFALKAVHNPWFGQVLTDGTGLSLYVLDQDRDCIDECRLLWPPVPADAVPLAGPGIDAQLIGSVRGPSGVMQATYNGQPLHYFAEDFVAGDVNGQGFAEFGHTGSLVSPDGAALSDQTGEDCGCHSVASEHDAVARRDATQEPKLIRREQLLSSSRLNHLDLGFRALGRENDIALVVPSDEAQAGAGD